MSKQSKVTHVNTSAGWANYQMPSGSNSAEIKRSVAQNRRLIGEESKIFNSASLIGGGIKTPDKQK